MYFSHVPVSYTNLHQLRVHCMCNVQCIQCSLSDFFWVLHLRLIRRVHLRLNRRVHLNNVPFEQFSFGAFTKSTHRSQLSNGLIGWSIVESLLVGNSSLFINLITSHLLRRLKWIIHFIWPSYFDWCSKSSFILQSFSPLIHLISFALTAPDSSVILHQKQKDLSTESCGFLLEFPFIVISRICLALGAACWVGILSLSHGSVR